MRLNPTVLIRTGGYLKCSFNRSTRAGSIVSLALLALIACTLLDGCVESNAPLVDGESLFDENPWSTSFHKFRLGKLGWEGDPDPVSLERHFFNSWYTEKSLDKGKERETDYKFESMGGGFYISMTSVAFDAENTSYYYEILYKDKAEENIYLWRFTTGWSDPSTRALSTHEDIDLTSKCAALYSSPDMHFGKNDTSIKVTTHEALRGLMEKCIQYIREAHVAPFVRLEKAS